MAIIDRVFVQLLSAMASLQSREEGQGLAEYGLILALVAVVAVGAVTLLGTNVSAKISSIATSI
jgi:pilus assembly protein Flp/PilA